MPKLAMHWWILIGLVAGVAYGYLAAAQGSTQHVLDYIQPIGRLFLNLLKMIAVPLGLFSLVAGGASRSWNLVLSSCVGKWVLQRYPSTTRMPDPLERRGCVPGTLARGQLCLCLCLTCG